MDSTLLTTTLLAVLSGLGLLGGIGLGIKALIERRTLNATAKATQSKAGNDDATAASIVAAAARELIDPLRRELATERQESAQDLERERVKVQKLQDALDGALDDTAGLRIEVRRMTDEISRVKDRLLEKDQQIIEKDHYIIQLEIEIARLKEARALNEGGGLASGPHAP